MVYSKKSITIIIIIIKPMGKLKKEKERTNYSLISNVLTPCIEREKVREREGERKRERERCGLCVRKANTFNA